MSRKHKASIKTTGDVYVQAIEESVLNTMNPRTMGALAGWEHPALINSGVWDGNQAWSCNNWTKSESDEPISC